MMYFVVARSFSVSSLSRGFSSSIRSTSIQNYQPHRTTSLVARHLSGNQSETNTDKEETTGQWEEYKNKNNIRDQVFSAISEDGSVKVTACTARNLLNDLMIAHTMTAVPADALGRTVVCALMMSNGMQAEQTCQLTLNGKMEQHFG